MESKIYNESSLWNVHSEEAKTWEGKDALVTHKDDSTSNGVIKEVRYAANTKEIDGVVEHPWIDILIEKRIPITAIKSLEVKY
jgi:hypothetical protein